MMIYENVFVNRSSNIKRLAFIVNNPPDFIDNKVGDLRIQFYSGSSYCYEDIPYELFRELVEAPSIGKFYCKYIRGEFHSYEVGVDFEFGFQNGTGVENIEKEFEKEKDCKSDTRKLKDDFVVVSGNKVFILHSEDFTEFVNKNRSLDMKIFKLGKCVIDW